MKTEQYIAKGYTVLHESNDFVTLCKNKSVNGLEIALVILGLLTILFMGLGLLFWLMAVISYMSRSDDKVTIAKSKEV